MLEDLIVRAHFLSPEDFFLKALLQCFNFLFLGLVAVVDVVVHFFELRLW